MDYFDNSFYDTLMASYGAAVTVLSLVLIILVIVGWWRVFEKAGEAGWKSIVPILNAYTLYKISWGNGWLFLLNLLGLIPIVGGIAAFIINIVTCVKLGKSYGKGTGFIIGLVLLPSIFMIILGFDDSSYLGANGGGSETF